MIRSQYIKQFTPPKKSVQEPTKSNSWTDQDSVFICHKKSKLKRMIRLFSKRLNTVNALAIEKFAFASLQQKQNIPKW